MTQDRVVHKFPLTHHGAVSVQGDEHMKPLVVARQREEPMLWLERAEDPDEWTHVQEYVIVGTGWPIDSSLTYVGTYIAYQFVWHVYRTETRIA